MKRRANGMGTLVLRGEIWYARWFADGKPHLKSTGETDRDRAEKVMMKIIGRGDSREERIQSLERELRKLKSQSGTAGNIKLTDLWTRFEELLWQSQNTEVTKMHMRCVINDFVRFMTKTEHIGFCHNVTQDNVRNWLQAIRKVNGASRYNAKLTRMKHVWRELDLEMSVFEGFRRMEVPKSHRQGFDKDELERLFNFVKDDPDTNLLFHLGLYTGMRLCDACNLKDININMDEKTITFIPHKTMRKNKVEITIPMHQSLVHAVWRMFPCKTAYLSEVNHHLYETNQISKKLRNIFLECGMYVSYKDNGKRIIQGGFHNFRHSWISIALNAGWPAMLVQRIAGHKSDLMTEHYFHQNLDVMKKGLESFPTFQVIFGNNLK